MQWCLQDELDDDCDELTHHLIAELAKLKLLYLHCIEPRAAGHLDVEPLPGQSLLPFRKAWPVNSRSPRHSPALHTCQATAVQLSASAAEKLWRACLCITCKGMSFFGSCCSTALAELACHSRTPCQLHPIPAEQIL